MGDTNDDLDEAVTFLVKSGRLGRFSNNHHHASVMSKSNGHGHDGGDQGGRDRLTTQVRSTWGRDRWRPV